LPLFSSFASLHELVTPRSLARIVSCAHRALAPPRGLFRTWTRRCLAASTSPSPLSCRAQRRAGPSSHGTPSSWGPRRRPRWAKRPPASAGATSKRCASTPSGGGLPRYARQKQHGCLFLFCFYYFFAGLASPWGITGMGAPSFHSQPASPFATVSPLQLIRCEVPAEQDTPPVAEYLACLRHRALQAAVGAHHSSHRGAAEERSPGFQQL